MKYLTDTEILNWNKRLEKSEYRVYPLSNRMSAEPYVVFKQIVKNNFGYNSPMGDHFVITLSPNIRYSFTFSISSNRKSEFFDLFDKLSQEKFGTKSKYIDNSNKENISDIKFTFDVVDRKEELKHNIQDKEYIRYTYHFNGNLGSVMAYISYLEDTMNYFNEIWGYNEDGSEVCLLKYPIGTVVSTTKDKSVDYLVLDYRYRKLDSKYYIDLLAAEMLNTKGSIIKYGDVLTFREDELCYSRNNRIDNILN